MESLLPFSGTFPINTNFDSLSRRKTFELIEDYCTSSPSQSIEKEEALSQLLNQLCPQYVMEIAALFQRGNQEGRPPVSELIMDVTHLLIKQWFEADLPMHAWKDNPLFILWEKAFSKSFISFSGGASVFFNQILCLDSNQTWTIENIRQLIYSYDLFNVTYICLQDGAVVIPISLLKDGMHLQSSNAFEYIRNPFRVKNPCQWKSDLILNPKLVDQCAVLQSQLAISPQDNRCLCFPYFFEALENLNKNADHLDAMNITEKNVDSLLIIAHSLGLSLLKDLIGSFYIKKLNQFYVPHSLHPINELELWQKCSAYGLLKAKDKCEEIISCIIRRAISQSLNLESYLNSLFENRIYLSRLDLRQSNVNDKQLTLILQKQPSIQCLNLVGCSKITDLSGEAILYLPQLRQFCIGSNDKITEKFGDYIGQIHTLEVLQCSGSKNHELVKVQGIQKNGLEIFFTEMRSEGDSISSISLS